MEQDEPIMTGTQAISAARMRNMEIHSLERDRENQTPEQLADMADRLMYYARQRLLGNGAVAATRRANTIGDDTADDAYPNDPLKAVEMAGALCCAVYDLMVWRRNNGVDAVPLNDADTERVINVLDGVELAHVQFVGRVLTPDGLEQIQQQQPIARTGLIDQMQQAAVNALNIF